MGRVRFAHPFSIVPPPASGDGEPAIDHELWAGAVVFLEGCCPDGFCLGGFQPEGILSGGCCPDGFCPGGLWTITNLMYS